MANKITLSISKDLREKLNKKIKETNFKSIQDYIIFILEKIVSDELNNEKITYTKKEEKEIRGDQTWYTHDEEKAYSEKEEADLKKNLKDLGYI